jgi:hypothetical protein
MAFDRQAAKEAGYTDDEINAFIAANPEVEDKNAQQQQLANEPPAPQTVIPELGRGAEMAATIGVAAVPVIEGVAAVAPYAAAVGAGYYAKNKLGQVVDKGLDVGKSAVEQMRESNAIQKAREARLQQRPGFGGAPATGTPTAAPAAGAQNYGNVRYNVPTGSAPSTPVVPQGPINAGPVVPNAMPAPAAPAGPAPSLLDKTTSMIRQLAANKVVQGLAKGANVLGGAQMAAYSPELGPKTPQVGRMRGMEINPLTNRPWTPQQIAQYEANPNVFDQQMAPPQMRR